MGQQEHVKASRAKYATYIGPHGQRGVPRKTRARGRHNRAKLERLNAAFQKAGLPIQSTLHRALLQKKSLGKQVPNGTPEEAK